MDGRWWTAFIWLIVGTNLIEMTNKMQLCMTILLFHCSLTAQHVSSDNIARNMLNSQGTME